MTKVPHTSRARLRATLWLLGALLLTVVLSGCQATGTPTLPAATPVYDQPQPAPATPTPMPTDPPPPPTATATPVPPTAVPDTPTPEPQPEPVSLTILHLNDVMGEVDPCG